MEDNHLLDQRRNDSHLKRMGKVKMERIIEIKTYLEVKILNTWEMKKVES
jgi:hypothetical protein